MPGSSPSAWPAPMMTTLRMPKMPILVMTPERGADTEEGAAGWASGSQEWSGTRPALTPNPARQRISPAWSQKGSWRAAPGATAKASSRMSPGSMKSAPPAHIT